MPVSFEGVDQGFHDSHGLAIDPHGRVQFNGSNTA
ncbi:PTS system N-acetylmuramic acid-specific EIIBC component [Gossypium arboreum]|uniref:PTS system N-acetylmuramic acid-specific EIIBC component n=1 Tax=Gossypium arboreum TaxID=29729 RepID=A0A0B0PNY1_GOSAR|nr:PTS system N-acetylmuramic acid-specific EIIBC component [Gossypium arboreum]